MSMRSLKPNRTVVNINKKYPQTLPLHSPNQYHPFCNLYVAILYQVKHEWTFTLLTKD